MDNCGYPLGVSTLEEALRRDAVSSLYNYSDFDFGQYQEPKDYPPPPTPHLLDNTTNASSPLSRGINSYQITT